VHWHDKFPADGREVTAEDVAYSLERQYTDPEAYFYLNYEDAATTTTISVVDNTVVLELADPMEFMNVMTMLDFMHIYPKDALELFGDFTDWEDSIGTGAFILEDYVYGDSLTYVRNDNYWKTNPVGPGEGDQLPYVDRIETLIVPDVSTADTLLQTGQVDVMTITDHIRAQAMIDARPDLEYNKRFDEGQLAIFFRTDMPDKPYSDERVRWALALAIDQQQILDTVYGGEGALLNWPIGYFIEYADAYVPLEDLEDDMIEVLPDEFISVADLYGQNLDLAQRLWRRRVIPLASRTRLSSTTRPPGIMRPK
jgi:peptide/nickel transport system substrate-binding protein